MRTEAEITEQLAAAHSLASAGQTGYPDATYEDGVSLALKWVLGESQDRPIDQEDQEFEGVRQLVAARRHLEPERVAVLRCAARVSNPVLIECLRSIARDWGIEDVRRFVKLYMEQRTARAALLAIAADSSNDKACVALMQTAVDAPLEEVNEVLEKATSR